MSVSLNLYDPLLVGNGPLGDYTAIFSKTWRRTIRRRGGFFVGTVDLTEKELTQPEMEEFFRYRLLAELRESGGGQETWRGFIAKMEYTNGNQLFTVDINRMSNAVKVIYTRLFNNLLTNGSAESGAWTAYNGATSAQSTAWRSDGTYSNLITVADTTVRGAYVQATIAIVAGQSYAIMGNLNVVGGSWRVSVNRADNDQSLAFFSTRGGAPGDYTVNMAISADNTYTGNVDLRITSEASIGSIYGDGFTFVPAPIPNVHTSWYQDANSIMIHGRKENVLLEIGKTSAAANAEAQTYLKRWGWPQPYPPTNYTSLLHGSDEPSSKLRITFAGYWATLNWLTVPQSISAGTIGSLITSLVGLQSTYLGVGTIEANATDYTIDNRGTLLAGDTIKDMAGDGSSGGSLYGAGVYANRKFDYQLMPAELTYHLRGGEIFSASDSLYEPWLARPGYALWQDLPIGPAALTANANNDPRWVFVEELEMLPDGRLVYNLEPSL